MARAGAAIIALLLTCFACVADTGVRAPTRDGPPPMVGFTFSPKALPDGVDPATALRRLLRSLAPDLVRLPVYWDEVQPQPTDSDFAPVDGLLGVVSAYDAARPGHHTRVILVAGARNVDWPELHVPDWTGSASQLAELFGSNAYRGYLLRTFARYATNPLLYGWQVENEPLDNTNPELGDVAIPSTVVEDEIQELREVDPIHPIVVTTYNSASLNLDRIGGSRWLSLYAQLPLVAQPAGHPTGVLQMADALGLDVYVVTPSTPLREAPAPQRIGWKSQTLGYWADEAARLGKSLWITEMQAAPWAGSDGFTRDDLVDSARAYRRQGESVVLLWGVESWLDSSAWMRAGQAALEILRS